MNDNLVAKLKPWVTTFSEAIRYQYHHKDELKVGGEIVRIFNYASFTKDEKDMVYVTLDDEVGRVSLMIPGSIYQQLDNKYSFKEGMIVLADGKLLDPEDSLKKTVPKRKFESLEAPPLPTLVCWNVEPYKEDTASEDN